MTTIEWTDEVWNPVVGCSRVSAGCEHCYAERHAHRGMVEAHRGLTVLGKHGPRWTGEVRCLPERLEQPLRWRKPRRVFVNSMSDLFHESVPYEFIAAVFGVMAACPQHSFQLLTKRPGVAKAFFLALARITSNGFGTPASRALEWCRTRAISRGVPPEKLPHHSFIPGVQWPLPNVWLGVSVEDQESADERIPLLLDIPAALRWVSYEPAIGRVRLEERWLLGHFDHCPVEGLPLGPDGEQFGVDPCEGCPGWGMECGAIRGHSLDWIVIGGESGPRARSFDIGWARHVIRDCRSAGVPVFVKQLGSNPCVVRDGPFDIQLYPLKRALRDRKGGDMSEWPEDLRIRQWPKGDNR